jgi:integrase
LIEHQVSASARERSIAARRPDNGAAVALAEFHAEWWSLYAASNLSAKTLDLYAYLWRARVEPTLGHLPLREITPIVIERWKAANLAAGSGPETIRRTMTMLQGVFQRAVEWEYLETNPVARVRRPHAHRRRLVRPLAPTTVERMRWFLGGDSIDAAVVSLLAYAGLRPGEALGLSWGCVRDRVLLVEQAVSMGVVKDTKTRGVRTVRLLAPLRDDLAAQRALLGDIDDLQLVIPRSDGGPWPEHQWRNWRRRVFRPAASAAGVAGARPYDLRHSFVSLLIAEGRNVIDVARQAGHNPTMTLETYGHVFDEFDGADRQPAEQRIAEARRAIASLG